jgi:hypothetical protein
MQIIARRSLLVRRALPSVAVAGGTTLCVLTTEFKTERLKRRIQRLIRKLKYYKSLKFWVVIFGRIRKQGQTLSAEGVRLGKGGAGNGNVQQGKKSPDGQSV